MSLSHIHIKRGQNKGLKTTGKIIFSSEANKTNLCGCVKQKLYV